MGLPKCAGKSFLSDRHINDSHAYSGAEIHPLSAQQPLNARHRPLDFLDKVVSGIQLERCVDAFTLVKSLDLLCIFLNRFQDWITGLGLPVPQGEVRTVRPPFRLIGEDVLLETRKPQGTGHALYPREHIRPVDNPAKEYPAIPRHAGDSASSFSALGMISPASSRR